MQDTHIWIFHLQNIPWMKRVNSGGSRISPRRGRQLPMGRGRQHTILPNFLKNCMKLKEFGPQGVSLRSVTGKISGSKNYTMVTGGRAWTLRLIVSHASMLVIFCYSSHFHCPLAPTFTNNQYLGKVTLLHFNQNSTILYQNLYQLSIAKLHTILVMLVWTSTPNPTVLNAASSALTSFMDPGISLATLFTMTAWPSLGRFIGYGASCSNTRINLVVYIKAKNRRKESSLSHWAVQFSTPT